MRNIIYSAAFAAALVTGCAREDAPAADIDILAQGKYIVDGVGLCHDCHTPFLPSGEPDETHALQGAELGIGPLVEMPWAPRSPALAGTLAGYSEESLAEFLQSGSVRADGSRPFPPMPAYRLNESDARAVAAYLASLPTPQ